MGKTSLCLLVVAIAILYCYIPANARPSRTSNADRQKFHQHVTSVTNFACNVPQSRVVKLDELGITVGPEETYIPAATVLKKCHCAGYCSAGNMECKAASTQITELIFKVVTHIGVESTTFKKHNVTEDVSCSCQ